MKKPRFISVLLSLVLLFATILPSFAAESEKLSSVRAAKTLDSEISSLWEMYSCLETDFERNTLLDEIIMDIQSLDDLQSLVPEIEGSRVNRSVAEGFVQFVSYTVSSNHYLTVRYQTLNTIPSGAYVKIGYEYPGAYRQPQQLLSANSQPGTYSYTFNTTITIGSRIIGTFSARDYSESVVYSKYYGELTVGNTFYKYHTVTSQDVNSGEIAKEIAFNFAFKIIHSVVGVNDYFLSVISVAIEHLNSPYVLPDLEAGNYIEYKSYITSDDLLHCEMRRYDSYSAYSSRFNPIESVSLTHQLFEF